MGGCAARAEFDIGDEEAQGGDLIACVVFGVVVVVIRAVGLWVVRVRAWYVVFLEDFGAHAADHAGVSEPDDCAAVAVG